AAARLSDRYITNRFLPDKAIDLIDEAAARLKTQAESKPEEIEKLDQKKIQLKIEESALKGETDQHSKESLKRVEHDLAEVEAKLSDLNKRWKMEKGQHLSAVDLTKQRETLRARYEKAKDNLEADYKREGEKAFARLSELDKQLKEINSQIENAEKGE